MTQINPKINMYQAKPSFKADAAVLPFMPNMNYADNMPASAPQISQENSQIPSVELPDIYYSPNSGKKNEGFVDRLRKVDIMELIVPWFEHPLLMLGTCFGISKGVDAFSKSCNKEYGQSVLGKAAKFGDKIENSNVIQSKPVQTGLKGLKSGWAWVKKTAMKSNIIRAMVERPTMPENPTARSELLSLQERNIEKFGEVLRDIGMLPDSKGNFGGKRLVDYHLDADAVQDLKTFFGKNNISEIPNNKAVSRYLLKKAGVAEAEIQEKLQSLLKGKSEAEINEIFKVCEKFKGIKTRKGTKIPFLTKQPLTNEAGFQDVYNRLYSTIIGKGTATKTGKFMSKFLQMAHRGFTFGGAKTGVLIWVAPHIMHTLINTYKAEWDEKIGTFMNGMVSAISWVFAFPLVLKCIHALGGIRYTGISEENYKEINRLIDEFNKNVLDKKAGYDTRKGRRLKYKECKSKIAELKNVKGQGFITRVLRKVSDFTKSDLRKLELFKDKNWFKRTLLNSPAKVKDFIWSAGRFGVFMMVGMPIVDKIINKCVSAIFGRNYDDMVEKENKEAKKKQKEFLHEDLQNRMYDAQAAKMGLASKAPEAVAQIEQTQEKAAETQEKAAEPQKQAAEPQKIEQAAEPIQQEAQKVIDNKERIDSQIVQTKQPVQNASRDNYTYIPSQENVLKTSLQSQMSKYIPSQLPGNVAKTFDNSGLEAALKRADRAEAKALQTLAGRFPS